MKLSIITINYNNFEGLKKTFDSVFNQTFQDFEYIVIDGGSTDGSKELIEFNKDKISYWVSEPDKGIYNAMNKGIKVAKGEYLLFLNSGDWLVSNIILEEMNVIKFIEDIIFTNVYLFNTDNDREITYPKELNLKNILLSSLPHSGGAFIKKFAFETIGLYQENLKISSDWCWYFEAIIMKKKSYKLVPKVLSIYDGIGISGEKNNISLMRQERKDYVNKIIDGVYELPFEVIELKRKIEFMSNSRSFLFKRLMQRMFNHLVSK